MKVLVCGTRQWANKELIRQTFIEQLPPHYNTLIHGAARGADTLASEVAREGTQFSAIMAFPAKWKKYGKRAGYIRNAEMLGIGKPELVIAFWDGKSPGTKMMIELARAAKVKVVVIEEPKK